MIFVHRLPFLTKYSAERFLRKLARLSDFGDALRRLDKLMQEEHRMATARDLRVTHRVNERLVNVENDVQGVRETVNGIDERVTVVDKRMQAIDCRLNEVDDKIDVIIDGAYFIVDWV